MSCGRKILAIGIFLAIGAIESIAQFEFINVGRTNNGGTAYNVAIWGRYAYLANGDDGLRVYDISDPTNPANVGHTNQPGKSVYDIALSGNHAFAAGPAGFTIYGIADPTNPVVVAHTNGGVLNAVALSGDFAYLVNAANSSLQVYDVAS